MLRIRAPQDFAAGLILLLVGAAGLVFGAELSALRPGGQLGSGTMPRLLSGIILGFSGLMVLRALTAEGPAIAPVPWRALAVVIAAIVLFGLTIERLGYLPTAIIVPFVAAAALARPRWGEAALVALLLGVGSTLLFVTLLGQPLPVWWGAR